MSNTLAYRGAPAAAVFLLALAGCQPHSDTSQARPQAGTTTAVPAERLDAHGTGRLHLLASRAVATQRFHSPAGDNAVEYYLALREKSPDDLATTTALAELQPYLVIAGEQALARAQPAEAGRLLDLLARVDAQAPALPRLRDALVQLRTQQAGRQDGARNAAAPLQVAAGALAAREAEPALAPAPRPTAPSPAPQADATAALMARGAAASPAPAAVAGTPPAIEPNSAAAGQRPRSADRRSAASAADAPTGRSLPRLVHDEPPRYPAVARNRKLEGRVEVGFTIQPDGSVSNVRVVGAEPAGIFERAAVAAAARWRFEPAGQPVNTTRELTFRLPRS